MRGPSGGVQANVLAGLPRAGPPVYEWAEPRARREEDGGVL